MFGNGSSCLLPWMGEMVSGINAMSNSSNPTQQICGFYCLFDLHKIVQKEMKLIRFLTQWFWLCSLLPLCEPNLSSFILMKLMDTWFKESVWGSGHPARGIAERGYSQCDNILLTSQQVKWFWDWIPNPRVGSQQWQRLRAENSLV